MNRPGLLCFALALCAAPAGAEDFFYHDGDRPILLLGDSITEQRMYTTYIEDYVLTRFPHWNVTFRNVGWSGDGAPLWMRGGQKNGLDRDILPLHPAAITIDFGMNDARAGDAGLPAYLGASEGLVRALKGAGARIALISPSPEERYEPGQPGGSAYNQTLAHYTDGLKKLADKQNVLFVDQLHPFLDVIDRGRKAGVLGASGDPRLVPDGIHPNWGGHLVMATAILKGLHAPAEVCAVEIANGAAKASGCRVEMLAAPPNHLKFQRTDAPLPWYAPPDADLVQRIPGFTPMDDLSRDALRVAGLTAPTYLLKIDGQRVGVWSAKDLGAGINLTTAPGPLRDQGKALFAAIQQKNDLYYARWRTVQLFNPPPWMAAISIEAARKAELDRLDAQIAAKEAEIQTLRQPLPHLFELLPTPPDAPTALQVETDGGHYRLRWQAAGEGITGFQIQRSSDGREFTPAAKVGAGVTQWTDSALNPPAVYYYRVVALGPRSASDPSAPVSNAWTGTGLTGQYFGATDLTSPKLTRIDPRLDFTWDTVGPDPAVGQQDFSVRWTGFVQPRTSEVYTFSATADDGVRVWVAGKPLINAWIDQGPTEYTGQIALEAGKKYPITVEYYQGVGGASLQLRWSTPSQPLELIPTSQLYPANAAIAR